MRDDKNADEATSAEQVGYSIRHMQLELIVQVSEFYQRQVTAGGGKKGGGEADDFW